MHENTVICYIVFTDRAAIIQFLSTDRLFGNVLNANACLGNQPETPLPPDMLSFYENIVDIRDNTTQIYPLGAKKQIQTLIRNTL